MATNYDTAKQVDKDHDEMTKTRESYRSDNAPAPEKKGGKDAGKFPKMKYSLNNSVMVKSAEEESALKGKYFDSPADVPENKETLRESGDDSGFVEAAPLKGAVGPERLVPHPVGPNNNQRDRLNFQAEGLGLKLDPAWTDEYCMHFIRMAASS